MENKVLVEMTAKIEDITCGGSEICTMMSFYNKDGKYVGNEHSVKCLVQKWGIVPETIDDGHKVCSIGKSFKDGKWYGWSHRAIYGFSVGDEVKEGDLCAKSGYTEEYLESHDDPYPLPVGFKAKDEEDCKKMAIAFASSVC